ncbi:WhiB family transcriptional regulator [Streptomyces microflavus]|uniref:WhiB family transcriptional regulator n=1 Tax=Streptomyces microflavus TaxID=1919 RepID=UPI00364B9BAB
MSTMADSLCAQFDLDAMFPAPTDLLGIAFAKQTCGECPARAECLEWALDPASRCNFGVFGGLTAEERRELIRQRNLGNADRLDYGKFPPKKARIAPAV